MTWSLSCPWGRTCWWHQGVGRAQALDALATLAGGAICNLREGGVPGAMTGPVSRGDTVTVSAHLDRLEELSPEAREIHRLLSRRLLDLSRSGGVKERSRMGRILGRRRSS